MHWIDYLSLGMMAVSILPFAKHILKDTSLLLVYMLVLPGALVLAMIGYMPLWLVFSMVFISMPAIVGIHIINGKD